MELGIVLGSRKEEEGILNRELGVWGERREDSENGRFFCGSESVCGIV